MYVDVTAGKRYRIGNAVGKISPTWLKNVLPLITEKLTYDNFGHWTISRSTKIANHFIYGY